MRYLFLFERILERSFDMLLSDHIFKGARAIFPIQCFCHETT